MGRPIDLAYIEWGAIDHRCPRCGAGSGYWCINPVNNKPSAVACADRYRLARDLTEGATE